MGVVDLSVALAGSSSRAQLCYMLYFRVLHSLIRAAILDAVIKGSLRGRLR